MPLAPPSSIETAHQELFHLLVKVQNLSGKTGSLAEDLAKKLEAHMEKEETLVLPLLGLLPDLTDERAIRGSKKKASRLYLEMKKQYPGMLEGHRAMTKLLSRLKSVGAEEGHLTAVRLCEALEQHSREEEEVLYPAALLAGRMVSSNTKAGLAET